MKIGLDFTGRKSLPLVLQSEAAECGLACIAMVCGYFGHHIDLRSLRQRYSVSLKGVTLAQLVKITAQLNLNARPLRLDLHDLKKLKLPAILHWELNHFVVLAKVTAKNMVIYDPANGKRVYTHQEFSKRFTGVALELAPSHNFEPKHESSTVKVTDLFTGMQGLRGALLQIFLFAGVLEMFALVSPLFMQLVVDHAIVAGDRNLLTVLSIGFLLLMLTQVGVATLRSWIVLYLSTNLNLQLVTNLFRRLLRLPMPFFEKRHLGDVMSRFDSLNTIQRTITSNFIETILDGVLAITTLVVIYVYSWELAIIVCIAAVLYGLLRLVLYRPLRQASEEYIVRGAREQTNFLETVRGMQSIKLFNREAQRQSIYENLVVDHFNTGIRVEKLNIGFQAMHKVIFGMENVLVIWIGATLVLSGGFSVGMLFAFMSYKQQFTSRIARLIENVIDFKMLTMHAERVADIALANMESQDTFEQIPIRDLGTDLVVSNLSIRYSEADPFVLKDVNFRIEPGEFVAIVGPSGCGKTTLMKSMLGLLPLTAGDVRIGGNSLSRIGIQQYRDFIGTVMQEDQLFSGTIADNISFFSTEPDQYRIEACAQLAMIHTDIEEMPMGYNSLIGDMGTVLSSGQKQRVLLARALYKRPQILFLDEATSHLDVECEKHVNEAIRNLNLTRVIIAHRPETIASSDRVIALQGSTIECEKEPYLRKEEVA